MKKNRRLIIIAAVAVMVIAAYIAVRSGNSGSGGSQQKSVKSPADVVRMIREGDMGAVRNYMEDESARSSLRVSLDLYEKELQYPAYSRPIDMTSYDLLNPYVFIPVQRPFPENDKLAYDVVIPRQVMFQGETIAVTLRVVSNGIAVPAVRAVKAKLIDEERGHKTIASFDLQAGESSEMRRTFTGEYIPAQGAQMGNYCAVVVTFVPEGYSELTASAQFTYADPAAKVTGMGSSRAEGPHLVIPVALSAKKPGDYRVTANLYSTSGDPLINAFGVSHIDGGDGFVEVKIHASALRAKGNPGPYVMKDFTVDRLPTMNDSMLYGDGGDSVFNVPRRSLSEYSDEKYDNTDEKRKLEQLKMFLK